MPYFEWDQEKNDKLKKERGISFDDIVFHIMGEDLLDVVPHPDPEKYAGQRVFVVRVEDYAYLVPFVESREGIFLKTVIPSRKATRDYLRGEKR